MPQDHRRALLGNIANVLLVTCATLAVGGVVWSFATGGLVSILFNGTLSAEVKIKCLREFFISFGAAAPAAYVLLTTVEVVAALTPSVVGVHVYPR